MRSSSFWGALFVLAVAQSACSNDASDSPPTDGGQPDSDTSGERLDLAARTELASLDLKRYLGQARISHEDPQTNGVVRVTFDPASGPICLRGGEFTAFYLDRHSDKLMIALDGGGACWTGLCAASANARTSFNPTGMASGDTDNYFHDWNIVFLSYCDGSVFTGDNDLTETDGTPRHQHGRQNLAAGIDVALQHFPNANQITVVGYSAGGYGTLAGMILSRLAYPKAQLFVVDDSGPGLQNPARTTDIETRLSEWKIGEVVPPSCTECQGGRGQLTALFGWMLQHDPTTRVSLLSYFEDPVIGTVFLQLGNPAFKELLLAETGKIHTAYPERFERYMLPGAIHVVSTNWAVTADGVPVKDWLSAMAQGNASVWKDVLASGP